MKPLLNNRPWEMLVFKKYFLIYYGITQDCDDPPIDQSSYAILYFFLLLCFLLRIEVFDNVEHWDSTALSQREHSCWAFLCCEISLRNSSALLYVDFFGSVKTVLIFTSILLQRRLLHLLRESTRHDSLMRGYEMTSVDLVTHN